MGQSLGCYQTLNLRHGLDHEQKLQLKQLLQLQQQLRHPDLPNAAKGLEGMLAAHTVLQKKQTVGVLIGGLSETVWNQQCTPEKLAKEHKDVDVMVLPPYNSESEISITRFEAGIDWWFPREEKIDIISDYSQQLGVNQKYWINGNGVTLSFGLEQYTPLSPGLYIHNLSFICKMREYEVLANTDVQIDNDALEAFNLKMEQRLKTSLPKFIREKFAGHILCDKYESEYKKVDAIDLVKFDRDTMKAIYRIG